MANYVMWHGPLFYVFEKQLLSKIVRGFKLVCNDISAFAATELVPYPTEHTEAMSKRSNVIKINIF